jgi:hypothetical protein
MCMCMCVCVCVCVSLRVDYCVVIIDARFRFESLRVVSVDYLIGVKGYIVQGFGRVLLRLELFVFTQQRPSLP